jgi:hypothetical protein
LGEVVVIVIGILIALSTDALWQNRQERTRGLEYLVALQGDMAESAATLTGAIRGDRATRGQYSEVLRWLGSDEPLTPTDQLTAPRGFAPAVLPTGMLDALVATGDINLIASTDLRAQIVGIRSLLDAHRASIASLESQGRVNGTTIGPYFLRVMFETDEFDKNSLRGEFVFIGAMNDQRQALGDRIRLLGEMLEAVEGLNRSLQEELGS